MNGQDIKDINLAVTFLPEVSDDTLPCLVVGGALVFAYFDYSGRLRVSVETDDIDERFLTAIVTEDGRPDSLVDMTITVNGDTVFKS